MVSLCSCGCPRTCCVDQVDLEFRSSCLCLTNADYMHQHLLRFNENLHLSVFRPISYHQTGASDDEKESSHPELPIWDRTEDFCDMLPVCSLWWRLGHEATVLPKGYCFQASFL